MQYYFSHDGSNQQGPVDVSRLREAGVTGDTLVWRDGMSGWTPARDVPELRQVLGLESAAPQLTPSQPQWPAPPVGGVVGYQSPSPMQANNGFAVTSMILGIVSLVMLPCYFFGLLPAILGVVFGHVSRGQIRRGQGTGAGMALAGLICSYLTVAFAVLLVGFAVLMFAMMPTPRGTVAPVYAVPATVPTMPPPVRQPTTWPTRAPK